MTSALGRARRRRRSAREIVAALCELAGGRGNLLANWRLAIRGQKRPFMTCAPYCRWHPARLLAVSVQCTFGLVLAVAFVG